MERTNIVWDRSDGHLFKLKCAFWENLSIMKISSSECCSLGSIRPRPVRWFFNPARPDPFDNASISRPGPARGPPGPCTRLVPTRTNNTNQSINQSNFIGIMHTTWIHTPIYTQTEQGLDYQNSRVCRRSNIDYKEFHSTKKHFLTRRPIMH